MSLKIINLGMLGHYITQFHFIFIHIFCAPRGVGVMIPVVLRS